MGEGKKAASVAVEACKLFDVRFALWDVRRWCVFTSPFDAAGTAGFGQRALGNGHIPRRTGSACIQSTLHAGTRVVAHSTACLHEAESGAEELPVANLHGCDVRNWCSCLLVAPHSPQPQSSPLFCRFLADNDVVAADRCFEENLQTLKGWATSRDCELCEEIIRAFQNADAERLEEVRAMPAWGYLPHAVRFRSVAMQLRAKVITCFLRSVSLRVCSFPSRARWQAWRSHSASQRTRNPPSVSWRTYRTCQNPVPRTVVRVRR